MKKLFLIFAASAVFWSCTEGNYSPPPQNEVVQAMNPHFVSKEQALQQLAGALAVIDGQSTRATNPRTVQNITTVTRAEIDDAATRTAESAEANAPAVYLVTFDPGEGSAILGADDRLEPVIAVYDTHAVTAEDLQVAEMTADSLSWDDLWCEEDQEFYLGMSGGGHIQNDLLQRYLLLNPPYDPGPAPNDSGDRNIIDVESGWSPVEYVAPKLETHWHQDAPYNEFIPNGYPAGCITIATAQIMAYNEFPKESVVPSFEVNGKKYYMPDVMPWNWKLMKAGDNDLVVEFLIKYVGDGCKVKYKADGSESTANKAKKFLKHIGYGGTERHFGYDGGLIVNMLKKDCPVLIGANPKYRATGHAWVIDGYAKCQDTIRRYTWNQTGAPRTLLSTTTQEKLFVHCNWGWGQNYDPNYPGNERYDGYYASDVFNTNDGPIDESEYGIPETRSGQPGNYNWAFRIITYSKPK